MALQLLPTLNAKPSDWEREARAGDRLPYLAQLDERTIVLRDQRLMQIVAIDGLQFETAETNEINYRKGLRDAMLQAIGSSRFALYHHIIRRAVSPALDGEFPDPLASLIMMQRRSWTLR